MWGTGGHLWTSAFFSLSDTRGEQASVSPCPQNGQDTCLTAAVVWPWGLRWSRARILENTLSAPPHERRGCVWLLFSHCFCLASFVVMPWESQSPPAIPFTYSLSCFCSSSSCLRCSTSLAHLHDPRAHAISGHLK